MALKDVVASGWLKDVNDNFDALDLVRVAGISEVPKAPEAPATTTEIVSRVGVVAVPDDGDEDSPGPLALVLADPVAGIDDGKILTIVSVAAQACTVTLVGVNDEEGEATATKGFNGDATKDLATFGGAIGDNIQLLAYGGVWIVLNSVNVTLSATSE